MQASSPDHKSASPSADDDPIFWRGGRFSYASLASVQCPMKKGRMGKGKRRRRKRRRRRRLQGPGPQFGWSRSTRHGSSLLDSPVFNSQPAVRHPQQAIVSLKYLLWNSNWLFAIILTSWKWDSFTAFLFVIHVLLCNLHCNSTTTRCYNFYLDGKRNNEKM